MSNKDMENFQNIEDEPFPSFLSSASLGNSTQNTLSNVTLGSTLGMPVAASTVAKIKPSVDNRAVDVQESYLEGGRVSLMHSNGCDGIREKFALSLKEELDDVDDFIAVDRFSALLVDVNLDETAASTFVKASSGGEAPPLVSRNVPLEITDLSTGLLSCHIVDKERMPAQGTLLPMMLEEDEDGSVGERGDSETCNNSITSFLANEKLMTVESMTSDLSDDDIDVNQLHDEELELYFKKLMPPAMQRGPVEGQEISASDCSIIDEHSGVTGMDSCLASEEENTEEEHKAFQNHPRAAFVGGFQRPHFRPGLEGVSSDDEVHSGTRTEIQQGSSAGEKFRNLHAAGAGGGDGSSEDEGGRISIVGLPSTTIQGSRDVAHGKGQRENGEGVHFQSVPDVDSQGKDSTASLTAVLKGTHSNFHLEPQDLLNKTDENAILGQTLVREFCDGLFGDLPVLNKGQSAYSKEDFSGQFLEASHLSQSFKETPEECNDIWNHQPDTTRLVSDKGANATDSVVYQNEEGKWVTDLAYYSSFEKEMQANLPEDYSVQFQSEDFLAGSQAMDKIIEDQEEFEKEHQFLQEEQIQAVNMSEVLGDTSWKIPTSSNILMRASQVSSELESGNQSYLRISLGEFFQRRSEALGCLGTSEEYSVKRPSFGYFITSPEKREPIALLRPSDCVSRGNPTQNQTILLNDECDLDKTLEAIATETAQNEIHVEQQTVEEVSQVIDSETSSSLLLSISTIASAIGDASISSDPAQLAAMIVELSKRSNSKSQKIVEDVSPAASLKHTDLLMAQQKSMAPGDLTTSDMEKYLKRAEASCSDSDGSSSQSCIDILSLADCLPTSNYQMQQQPASTHKTITEVQDEKKSEMGKPCQKMADTCVSLKSPKTDVKRSGIPRRSPESSGPSGVETTHCNFRPSTSPLTHSSPSQGSIQSEYGDAFQCSPSGGKTQRSPAGDPGSPHSHCSSQSLGRLTYLSINDTWMPPPDSQKQKNISMALSTTIIRASPTPPIDSLSNAKSPELIHHEGIGHDEKSLEASGKSENVAFGNAEIGVKTFSQIDSVFSNKINLQRPLGKATEQAQQLVSHILGYGSCFGRPEDLTHGSVQNYSSRSISPNIPNSLMGHPFLGSNLAQQYMSSEGSLHAPFYHTGGSSGMCRVSPAEYQMPKVLQNTHHPPQIPVSKTCTQINVESWADKDLRDLRTQVLVPSELKFPSSCCVGIASQTSLNIFNPTERWQQVSISLTNTSIDGEKVESFPFQWLIFKNKTIIGPKCTEEQKVLFIAPKAGLYQCTISVSSWPVSTESDVAHAEIFAKKVVMIAVAENPAIEVDLCKKGCLDFGDLAEGSAKALPLRLINKTRATVPIRLVISANASAWHCFSLYNSLDSLAVDGSLTSNSTRTSLSTSSVINHVLHSSDSENQERFSVWVKFSAPQKYIPSSGDLGPPDEFNARIDIEVDSPGPSHVIQSVPLRARSGTPRVHAPKDLQTVFLQAILGQTDKQTLPLKNAGNIDVLLRLKVINEDRCFTVNPEELTLKAGEEKCVVVSFTPQTAQKNQDSMLTILVLPSGPQYEVMLKGEFSERRGPSKGISTHAVSAAEIPTILSNKQFVAWGGVTLGRAVQQKLVLRNNSPATSQQLRLLIRGQDQDCFQLQSSFGPEERLTRNRELCIKPKEDVTVHLLFAPTRVASMLAKLEIKHSMARTSHPGVKFTIPLSGYGGTSNVILEDVMKRSDGYVASLNGVHPGRVCKLRVCVRNTGSRAAFVKVVSYSNLQHQVVMDPSGFSSSPSQFVLKERTQEAITITMKASVREQALCQSGAALLATVCLFCGDEVSRQQFRSFLQIRPEAGKKVLSENSLLKNIHFDEMFLGEELIQEAYDLPQRPNEPQIFYANMSKVMLSVFGSTEISDSTEKENLMSTRSSQLLPGVSDSGLDPSSRNISNVSLDVLPVKGPSEAGRKKTEPRLENTWSMKPENLVLTLPTINSTAVTRHVQIQNLSDRELSYELSWPAHCLIITPQHGVIEPQSQLQILVSPNPSLATKLSMLPWSGRVYVQCDNQQKSVKVQIRQDLAMDVSTTDHTLCPLPPQAETPFTAQKSEKNTREHQVEIKNRTVIFPSTASGESSEASLEVENHGEEVRWYLSSFAPPYVKGVDGSGDVYRATYSAFRCEKVSGTLGVQERIKVQFSFLPRDHGDYAQFWDLECHPASKPQHKSCIRFQLCGTGMNSREGSSVLGNKSLVKTEASMKNRKTTEHPGSKTGSSIQSQKVGVYAPQSLYTFPSTRVGATSTLKVNFRNNSSSTHELSFICPKEPFWIKHSNYSLRPQHYINLPVQFVPTAAGHFSGRLLVQTDADAKLAIELSGDAMP
ncbi:hypothetical protein DNTS_029619 [Danionella cerebrum]|uniref:Centrosomal protein of 192 kDa n=1 Tax=Danionella cerebrum TaxID=2873325 RepID=A0A553N5Q7_9TELE|nr:hypothetical protein DNTS_029619 [Danionella translucida]